MKRAADKQLSKDDMDGDDDVEDVGTGFKKADESVLARRPIKALPKRSLAGAASASATSPSPLATSEPPAATPKFTGFSGFGSNVTTPVPFGSATSTTSQTSLSSSSFSFSNSPSSQPTSSLPSVSSSASDATKAFASFVSSLSTPGTASTPRASGNEMSTNIDDKEVEYYKALRGLNVSLLSAISKAIEADPFVDVAHLLERYKSLRVSVDSDREGKAASTAPSTGTNGSPQSASKPVETSSKPRDAPSFSMPAPPSSFAGFKPATSSSSTSTAPSGSGFVPKIDTSSSSSLGSPFSFGASKPSESTSSSEVSKAAFTFGSTSSSSTSSSNTSSGFSFGAPSSGTSLFGKSNNTSGSTTSLFGSAPPTSSSTFGTSLFGKSADASENKESVKAEEKDAAPATAAPSTSTSTSASSLFGSGANPFATSTPEKSSSSSSGFSFGSASPSKTTFFGGGFPKAGSIGNPVGFGFGSPPKTPEAESSSGPIKSLPFTFGAPKPTAEPSKAAEGEEKESAESDESTPAPAAAEGDAAPPVLAASTSVHDLEGEGEEDEITTHSIRSKVYKMIKDKDGKAQWGDMGVGVLRLKKHKETESRRMLLRNSSTGKITINFLLYAGMNTSVNDKVVSFIGHEEGKTTPYRIRTKTAAQANELKAALDREIEFVRAKSETF